MLTVEDDSACRELLKVAMLDVDCVAHAVETRVE